MRMHKSLLLPLSVLLVSTGHLLAQVGAASDEDVFVLSPFVVQTNGADRYREDQAASGSIIAMDRIDLPMDITVLGENLIEEMALYNADELGEVVAVISSNESVNSDGGGGNTNYTLRGFRSVPRRNGFAPGGRLYDMTSVGRVEVIKGPNSVLYGQTDPGGIINFIPKRPLFTNRTNLTATYGSNDHVRLQADITGPIGSGKKLAYRLPMSFRTYGSEIDYYKNERTVIAPSLLWRLNKTTELFVETEYIDQEVNLADNTAWEKLDADGNRVTDYDKGGLGRSFNERGPNTYSTNEQFSMTAGLSTKVGENLHLRAMYTYNERDTYIQNVNPGNLDNRRILNGAKYPAFIAYPENLVRGYKLDALYERDFGGIEMRTLLGYEYNYNMFATARYNATKQLAALPNPLNGETVTRDSYIWTLGDPFTNPENFRIVNGHPTRNHTEWTNVRLTETLHLFEDRLIFLGGVARGSVKRVVNGEQLNATEYDTTYMVGMTYKFTPGFVGFVNTTTSFVPVFRTDIEDRPLDPASGEGFELGLKFNLKNDALFATVTYFDLTNQGLPRQVPSSESPTGQGYWINSGEENAKGVELELQWNVTTKLEVYLSLTQFDGELVSPTSGIGTPGADIPRSPEMAGQLTFKYRFSKDSSLKGLRFGLTGSFKDATPIKPNYSFPTIMSDSFFILNGFVRYRLPTQRHTEVFLNLKNLLDEEYILPNNDYGALMTVNIGLQTKF
jgi:iron complex outermembrane receptor protein